jgi:tetratricopeptide (TPR) repeat protein
MGVTAALGAALAARHGYADPDAEAAYLRARALAAAMPAAVELFPVMFGLVAFFTARGRFDDARMAGDHLLRSASAADDPGLTVVANFSVGMIDLYEGDLASAIGRLRAGLRHYDPAAHHRLAYSYIFDPGVACHRALAVALVLAGRGDEAVEHMDSAIELASQLGHAFSLASAHAFAAISCQLRGERDAAREHSARAIAVAEAHGFTFWALTGHMMHGWATRSAGRDELAGALTRYRAGGTVVMVPYLLGLLAELTETRDEAVAVAREACTVAESHGETWYLPRLRALLHTAGQTEVSRPG